MLGTARKIGATVIEKSVEVWSTIRPERVALCEGTALTAESRKLGVMPDGFRHRVSKGGGGLPNASWRSPSSSPRSRPLADALGRRSTTWCFPASPGAARLLAAKGDAADGVTIRAHGAGQPAAAREGVQARQPVRSRFLDLPIGIENPVERLYAVRANMNALKGSFQPVLALGLLAAMGGGPQVLQDPLLCAGAQRDGRDDQRAGTAAAALPRRRADQEPHVLGTAVRQHRMGVSIISYDGRCSSGSSPTPGCARIPTTSAIASAPSSSCC